MKSGNEIPRFVSMKCAGQTISVKSGEVTSDYIEDLKVVHGTTSLRLQYDPTSLTILSGIELGDFPMPVAITNLGDAQLGALCKLMARIMEVRTI